MKPSVTIMSIADVELVQAGIGREGSMAVKQFPLDSGVPGVQLEFSWNAYDKGYGTPRHRHTFDQYRYALDGKRMIKDGFLEEGECGFYPEGVYYGPQDQEEATIGLGLQFQGLSGLPYLTHVDLRNARKVLAAEGGTFKDGIYTKTLPDGRKINKDSHAACVEYLTGQKIEFPEGRFEKPIVMRPQGHPWIADRKFEGVEHKRLGTFGGSGSRLMRLAPGAKIPAHVEGDAEIRYLIEGSITYDGKTWQGGKTKDTGTYMFVQAGAELGEMGSANGGTFFIIELPMLADIAKEQARKGVTAVPWARKSAEVEHA
jgi:quercetin dioxygenase-like cupin family protein